MAVLPHVLSNKLAQQFLENTQKSKVIKAFNTDADERLLKSFSRRLGYLNESQEVKEIISNWLSEKRPIVELNSRNTHKYCLYFINKISHLQLLMKLYHLLKYIVLLLMKKALNLSLMMGLRM